MDLPSSRPLVVAALVAALTAVPACGADADPPAADAPALDGGARDTGSPDPAPPPPPPCDDATCPDDGVCVDGACRAPSEAQREQAARLDEALTYLRERTAWHAPLDWSSIVGEAHKDLFRGDGTSTATFAALFHAFVKVPQGHQGLYLADGCGTKVPLFGYTTKGVCGQPHPDGVVVGYARAGNAAGLVAGDVVLGVGETRGRAFLERLAATPACVTSRPSESFAFFHAAAGFLDVVPEGETLEVRGVDGRVRQVRVPPGGGERALASCADPFGRPASKAAEAYVRPDGVAVVRVPSFVDPEVPFPEGNDPAAFETYRANFEAKIAAVFDTVKTARAIVWDVRGNGGGLTAVGLAIASGFPGARDDLLSSCKARVVGSDPPSFGARRYASYRLTPGGRFAFTGKVAVLIDGQNYSAADYFPLATRERTGALLVGSPTAGGFGATSDSRVFAGDPAFSLAVDLNLCLDAADVPLEGRAVEPHVRVGYEPADLAQGRDTVLERAIRELDAR